MKEKDREVAPAHSRERGEVFLGKQNAYDAVFFKVVWGAVATMSKVDTRTKDAIVL